MIHSYIPQILSNNDQNSIAIKTLPIFETNKKKECLNIQNKTSEKRKTCSKRKLNSYCHGTRTNREVFKIIDKDWKISASSKANFTKLTPEEQCMRFINQRKTINKLKKKLMNEDTVVYTKDLPLENALKRIHSEYYLLKDQENLIENLCSAINEGKLIPGSLGYSQICTILRDILKISCPEANYGIKSQERLLALSSVEYETYNRLKYTPELLSIIVGRPHMPISDDRNISEIIKIEKNEKSKNKNNESY